MKVVQDLKWYQLKSVEDLKIVEKDGVQPDSIFQICWRLGGTQASLELAVMRAIQNQKLASKKAFCWCNRVLPCVVAALQERKECDTLLCLTLQCDVCLPFSFSFQSKKARETNLRAPMTLTLAHGSMLFPGSSRHVQAARSTVRVIWSSIWKSCWLRNSLLPKEVLHSMQTNNLELALLVWNSTEKHWVFGNIAS